MFAVGHFAFGYVLSKASAKLTKTNINIPTILMLSVIPDIDLLFQVLFQGFPEHRGPMHSVIMAFFVFVPIFVVYRKRAIPYFIALIQHSLVSDYIAGGQVQLLWPVTTQKYGIGLPIRSPANIALEWMAFLTAMVVMVKTRDIVTFFQSRNSNLILLIPTCTVLLPTFFSVPLNVPFLLIPPHLVYLALFVIAIVIGLLRILEISSDSIFKFNFGHVG